MRLPVRLASAFSAAVLAAFSGAAQAEIFGGVDFPSGVSSFADAVQTFTPNISGSGQPTPFFLSGKPLH